MHLIQCGHWACRVSVDRVMQRSDCDPRDRQGLIWESLDVVWSQQGDIKSQREMSPEPKSNCWGIQINVQRQLSCVGPILSRSLAMFLKFFLAQLSKKYILNHSLTHSHSQLSHCVRVLERSLSSPWVRHSDVFGSLRFYSISLKYIGRRLMKLISCIC